MRALRDSAFIGGTLLTVGVVAAAMSFSSASAQEKDSATVYHATLTSLTNSGAHGEATLQLSGNKQKTLLVHITASGLEPGGSHISHIHGRSANGQPANSTCPTSAQDTDGDGFVELAEGQVTYGPILIDFMNIDPDQDGVIDFRKTVKMPGAAGALPLMLRHIVIHGMSVGAVGAGTPGEVDGTAGYKVVLPVLCGAIEPVARGRDPLQFRKTPGG